MSVLTILIPVYRNQLGLDRTFSSLRDASGSFDVVIVDDGSPQPIKTPASLREDIPVVLLRLHQNGGIAAALNHGLQYILEREYRFIARIDAGDTVARERFVRQAETFDRNPACAVVGSYIEFVDTTGRSLFCYRAPETHHELVRAMHLNNCILHSGSMLRTDALRELGVYKEDCPGAEDYELFLRISRRYELAVIPEILTRNEYALDGLSVAGRREQQRTRLTLQIQYFDARCWTSYCGIARTLLALMAPRRPALQLKLALANLAARRKPLSGWAAR